MSLTPSIIIAGKSTIRNSHKTQLRLFVFQVSKTHLQATVLLPTFPGTPAQHITADQLATTDVLLKLTIIILGKSVFT